MLITGDIHGTMDISKLPVYFAQHDGEFTKEDYLLICGDVAVCGFEPFDEAETRRILHDLPVTVLFIDGNHENFDKLNDYPVNIWNGGKVHFIEDDIIHLMRGQVYTIGGATFFTFGGAFSIDRANRVINVTWFPEEIPTQEEYEEGWTNLEKIGFEVDYILSHTGPREVVAYMGYDDSSDEESCLQQFLQCVADNTEFQAWYFGHFHEDAEVDDRFFCLYDNIVEL